MSVQIVQLLAHPVVTAVLLSMVVLGLHAESRSAGFGKGAVAAFVAVGLLLFSHRAVGRAAAAEILLFVVGVGLVTVRIQLTPRAGLVGLAGAGLAFAGLCLSLLDPQPTARDCVRVALVVGAAALIAEAAARTLVGRGYISPRAILRRTVWRIPPFR